MDWRLHQWLLKARPGAWPERSVNAVSNVKTRRLTWPERSVKSCRQKKPQARNVLPCKAGNLLPCRLQLVVQWQQELSTVEVRGQRSGWGAGSTSRSASQDTTGESENINSKCVWTLASAERSRLLNRLTVSFLIRVSHVWAFILLLLQRTHHCVYKYPLHNPQGTWN